MKRSCAVLFFLLLFLSVFLPNLIFSAETRKPSVAVLWFENRTPDRKLDYLDQLIPDLITTESSKLHFCNLLEREEIEKALDEVVLSGQGFTSPKEKVKGGIAETTDFILSGYFEKKEEGLVVSVRLYNWKKGISQTKNFTYSLSEIKERVGKEITEYLQKSINLKDDREERAATTPENAHSIIIFLDVRHTFFNYDVAADNIIYDYPYGIIFLEELKDDLQLKGVSCEIITSKEDWDKILQKDSVPAQPARIYQIFVNISVRRGYDVYPAPPLTIGIWALGTTDSPINSQTADRNSIKIKEFSTPFSSFASLKNDVSQYILGSAGKENYGSEISSPKAESLIYYANYFGQKGYGDYAAACQEILKALYLYPDFSFYWFMLKESCFHLEKLEKEEQVTEIYLGLSSWNEHFLIYSDTLRIYILKLAAKRMLSSRIAVRLIPLMEKIIYEGYESNDSKWRKTDSAVLLSRLYLLGEAEETKLRNLKENGLISEAEYQNDLCWALLMNKLDFTKDEGLKAVNWSLSRNIDWENYSLWYAGIIPFFLPDSVLGRFKKNIDTQREFLSTVQETVKSYPDAAVNCYIIRIISEKFDHDLVEKKLAKIAEKVPNSLAAHYINFLRLKEEFFSTEGDKKQLIKEIAGICDTLGDESLIRSFLQESVKKKVDEETLLFLFSELLKQIRTGSNRIGLINDVAPASIRSRLESELGLKREEPEEEGMKGSLSLRKIKEAKVLVDAELGGLKEAIESVGWGVDIFSKEMDLSSLSKYKLIILHLSSLGSWEKPGGFVFQPSLLPRIIAGLDNGVFILIIPGKSSLITKINPFLSQFNCYVDEEKEIGSEAVFLPGIFKDVVDTHLDYHSSIGISPGVSWQWERFFIKGPPVYIEKGKVLIQSVDGYPLAVSIPLSNGTFIISGSIHQLLNLRLSLFNACDLYEGLIFRNIWQILLKEVFDYESVLTPVSTIKELYNFYWEFRLGEKTLVGQDFVDPFSGWIKGKRKFLSRPPFPEEKVLASAEILQEVLKENPDPVIRNYCFFYLGLIRRFQKQDEEAISYFKKARENAINDEDYFTTVFFLVDTLLRKENFSKDDYELCSKYCKEGTGIKEERSFLKKIRFYDLQGRLEEKMKNYPGAVAFYAEMASVSEQMHGTNRQYLAYALYRRACLIYKSDNLDAAEKFFRELIESISKDYNLKPDSWSESDFYSQSENGSGLIPVPFEIKVASYLYLREIAEKENRKFVYQTELEEVIEAAEKRNITDKGLLVQLRNVILREH